MEKEALNYFEQGCNCSQCIIKALESYYNLNIDQQCVAMCSAVNSGFGVGGMCSLLTAGIMSFGLLFDEATAKRLRMKLLNEFTDQYDSINCGALIRDQQDENGCKQLICDVAGLIRRIIDEENNPNGIIK